MKNLQGQVILDVKTGKPAAFDAALLELINVLPNKANILRGSGKTGSGSSGGNNDTTKLGEIDFTKPLTAEQLADPKVKAAYDRRMSSAGGIQIGSAFDKAAAKA